MKLLNQISARLIHNPSISLDVSRRLVLPPEVLRQGEKVDQKSDIWALGIAVSH